MIIAEDKKFYLPHSTTCFICGADNERGLKCRFFATENGNVHLHQVVKNNYAGFTDVVHGGIQTAIMDEAMGWCGFTQTESETLYFTRDINLKFKRNVISNQPIFVETMLVDLKRGFAYTEGVIRDESGTVLTTSTGIFVPIPEEKMIQTANGMLFINDGRQYHEKAMRICKPQPSDK